MLLSISGRMVILKQALYGSRYALISQRPSRCVSEYTWNSRSISCPTIPHPRSAVISRMVRLSEKIAQAITESDRVLRKIDSTVMYAADRHSVIIARRASPPLFKRKAPIIAKRGNVAPRATKHTLILEILFTLKRRIRTAFLLRLALIVIKAAVHTAQTLVAPMGSSGWKIPIFGSS